MAVKGKSNDLGLKPANLEELKFILRTISSIKDMSLDVETDTRDVQERYRVLGAYGCIPPGGEGEVGTVERLPRTWDELVLQSKNVDASLWVVKKKFTQVTTARKFKSGTYFISCLIVAGA